MSATAYMWIPIAAIGAAGLLLMLAGVLADICRAILPPRNRRRFGTVPRDERGDFLHTVPAIQARQIISGNSRKGWRTRRGNQAAAKAAQMDADVRRCLAMETPGQIRAQEIVGNFK